MCPIFFFNFVVNKLFYISILEKWNGKLRDLTRFAALQSSLLLVYDVC